MSKGVIKEPTEIESLENVYTMYLHKSKEVWRYLPLVD